MKYRVGIALMALMTAGFSVDALAQEVANACFTGPARLSDADISSFLSNPGGLLSEFPAAGLPMTSRVRSLAGSSASTLDPIMALLPQASSPQKSAIGAGLARVAKACAASSPAYAQLIQEKIAAANSPELTTAFLQTTNEVQTAALAGGAGGGGGGGASGLAGGGSVGGSTGGVGGDSSVASGTTTFSVGSGGSFTAAARSVSP
ncbi:hypothetical protein [Rhizobium sp. 007]|uniref:hypothetical protein n=1 Tax=Rhizobium sp. 007 TaxID=2785056 RepID=UPI00188DEA6E|nr:hypothetical protein [Rhizobium sp. 007]QPB22374.1 hypothetical protein ISN39_22355 [Rhizobium sp. 007]